MIPRLQKLQGELLISIGFIVLGVFILIQTQDIATTQGYEQIGPRLFPVVVGAGLVFVGGSLGWHALVGGWRDITSDQEGRDIPNWFAFSIINIALILHMVLIGSAGFVLASTLLFILAARGFGSHRWLRDACIGAVLAIAAFYLFTLGLGLNLSKGPFSVI